MTILIRSTGAECWKDLLADPKHWRTGYSAKSLAHCWSEADGMPPEIRRVFDTSPLFAGAQTLIAIPEHKVQLPGAGRASQTDLWLLLRTAAATVSVAVEGKVNEAFGETVGDWLAGGGENRQDRLSGLAAILGLADIPDGTRYQLLHRTASAILEAQRFMAPHAVMLVHSFSQTDQWFDDFASFVSLLGATPTKDSLINIESRRGPTLHVAWVRGDPTFLSR